MPRIPPSHASPHHLIGGTVWIGRVSGGWRFGCQVTDLAFETCSLLGQLVVGRKSSTEVGIAVRIRNIRSILARRDRFASRRVIARFDLQDSQTRSVADVAELGLPPMSLVDRGCPGYVFVEAPLA